MKKTNFKRVFSLALMLVMLVSLASIGVSATRYTPITELFEDKDMPGWYSWKHMGALSNDVEIVVNVADFDQYIQPNKYKDMTHELRDVTLELAGVKLDNWDELWGENLTDEVVIPEIPNPWEYEDVNAGFEALKDWMNKYTVEIYDQYGDIDWINKQILVVYNMHKHDLAGSQMYFDDNYHWQLCTECANRVYLANHTDKDNDGKCDFCGNAIRYYNVTVKDTTGGKVTLSANKGAMNAKIGVTVTPDAGYHLEALNFVNANAMHSKRAVWEDTPNAEYHFFVANWDVEVEAVFVKD